jgi:hypothetical protein
MTKRTHPKGYHTVVIKVDEPKEWNGLYRLHLQPYKGSKPDGRPYFADMTKAGFNFYMMKIKLSLEYGVPETVISDFCDAAYESDLEQFMWNQDDS